MVSVALGSHIGGYQIQRLLGQGGMGHILLAKQESLEREVALKVLNPDLVSKDGSFADRFVAEAKTAGKLSHPNIIPVYDVGHAEYAGETLYYFSMEFVDGYNCRQLVERDGTFDLDQILKVITATSEALTYAHKIGMIHRDIKPDNIMIAQDGQVKLADFGLAFQREGGDGHERGDSGLMKLEGTPHYMSPEQVTREELTPQSDLYSLGATLFYLLTGEPPYKRSNTFDAMRAHVSDPVPDPSQVKACPGAWRDLCMRLMDKDPDVRPSAAELGQEARRAADRTTAIYRRQSRLARERVRPEQRTKPVSEAIKVGKNPLVAAIVGGAVVLLVLVVVVLFTRSGSQTPEVDSDALAVMIKSQTSTGDPVVVSHQGVTRGGSSNQEAQASAIPTQFGGKGQRHANLEVGSSQSAVASVRAASVKNDLNVQAPVVERVKASRPRAGRAHGHYTQDVFVERGGVAVIDVENITLPHGWSRELTLEDYRGRAYLRYTGSFHRTNPGPVALRYPVQIQTPGRYLFEVRSRNGAGATKKTEQNDIWISMEADAIYAQLRPELERLVPIKNDYFMLSVGSLDDWIWKYQGTFMHGDEKRWCRYVFLDFHEPGVFDITLYGRSPGYTIDRMRLVHSSQVDEAHLRSSEH